MAQIDRSQRRGSTAFTAPSVPLLPPVLPLLPAHLAPAYWSFRTSFCLVVAALTAAPPLPPLLPPPLPPPLAAAPAFGFWLLVQFHDTFPCCRAADRAAALSAATAAAAAFAA